ncbi:MAG: hypothetical protein K5893_01515 [Prevotella sp.]|nr:hypothetical protein [Prevotella sp.]
MNCRIIKHILALFLVLTFLPAEALADGSETLTHAQSMSRKWKGIDVDSILRNSKYANVGSGRNIYLFNVGTGRFIIDGGSWGVEGRLFHEDFGRKMQLLSSGKIDSGIEESNISSNKHWFGCNPPENNSGWSNYYKYCFTTIMDCNTDGNRTRVWSFDRVETDPNADTYTYYMTEKFTGKAFKTGEYHLGAAWGEYHVAGDKGDGTFVLLDHDRVCWTTDIVKGNTEKKEVDGNMIPIEELYQWRVISEEEFIRVLNEETVGLNPSISSLIPDRDFTRNSNDFIKWETERNEDAEYTQEGRYGYTWGYADGQSNNKTHNDNSIRYYNEAWNAPVALKETFDDKKGTDGDEITDGAKYGLENSKYGYLSFEGVGRVHTEFEVPYPGWYQIQCFGFCQSDDNDAYLYAQVKGSSATDSYGGFEKANLERVASGTYSKDRKANCLVVGKELTKNGEAHKTVLWICVTEEQFNDGYTTLVVGFGKDAATMTYGGKKSNKNYYYDSDWVCVDDIRATSMGFAPAFFYEDEESLEYLGCNYYSPENDSQYANAKQFQTAQSESGRYSGATNLERTLKTDQWNSFSFPIPLTGEQIRYAFGEKAVLAKIHSIGNLSKNANVIDFQTVDLMTSKDVVLPGNFYLLKPTQGPTTGIDPKGNKQATYYQLGRNFFSVRNPESGDYGHATLSMEKVKGDAQHISSYNGENDGTAYANYIQTPGYSNFTVSGGTYSGTDDTQGAYAPNGSYVVSNNTIYHLNRDTKTKGFRGWITLTNAINSQASAKMAITDFRDLEGQEDGTSTPVSIVQLSDDTSVYDLYGRKVGTIGMKLPKGIYIVKGKKFMVH